MGNDWNEFMQSRPVRIFLYALCTACCLYYSFGAVMDIVSPGDSAAMLIASMGQAGFMVMTVIRLLVCLWAAFSFGRMTLKAIKDDK